jgi:hypothetical protein
MHVGQAAKRKSVQAAHEAPELGEAGGKMELKDAEESARLRAQALGDGRIAQTDPQLLLEATVLQPARFAHET